MHSSNDFAYVPQGDILIGDLTAREMLTNNAVLKLTKPRDEIEDIVEKLLKEFDLAHVADNKIGTIFRRGLSGGQKKRVDVGIEFVAPPLVLFLDEPTRSAKLVADLKFFYSYFNNRIYIVVVWMERWRLKFLKLFSGL